MSERDTRTNRRDFLKTSSATAGLALAGGLTLARSAHAAGSDILKVALIGCGGRGTGAAENCLDADPAVRIVALADAFEDRLKFVGDHLRKKYKDRATVARDRIFVGLDAYLHAIASGVDMVILTTPPGFRPQQYAAAIQAGKNVFMEKPCCVDAPGYRKLLESNKLADQRNLKVGVGLQRHHQSGYLKGVADAQEGKLGKILFMRVYWNGGNIWVRRRKPTQTEMQYQVRNWYHFCWLSGDNICEQHIHNLDVANWVMKDHPVEANGMGGCQERYLGENKGVGQIFDHHFVEFTYKDGTKLFSQCRQINHCWSNVSESVHGTKGSSSAATGGGPKMQNNNPYVQEHIDLIRAIRDGDKYNEGHYGATSSMTAVFGRMATYSGQVVKWDDAVKGTESDFPTELAWNAKAPVCQDKNGNYPMPMPGVYKPY